MSANDRSDTDSPVEDVPVSARNRDIAERTKRLREMVNSFGGPQAIAKKSRIPLSTLNKYLAGRDMPAHTLVRLANACGLRVEWLATGENGSEADPERLARRPSRAANTDSQSGTGAPRLFSIVHVDKLAGAMEAVIDNFGRNNVRPPMHQIVQAALLLYDIMNEPGFDPSKASLSSYQDRKDND